VVQSDTAGGAPIESPCSNIPQVSLGAEACNAQAGLQVCANGYQRSGSYLKISDYHCA
jgi:hypothetical protein